MRWHAAMLPAMLLLLQGAPACGSGEGRHQPAQEEGSAMAFKLTSPAFDAGASIPPRHTCDGEDLSPELRWTEPPAGTRSLALVSDDPDAPVGTWVHWVLFGLPPETRSLPEGLPTDPSLSQPAGARQGVNDFGRSGYGGPCPPPGKAHRYFFRLYALDVALDLQAGATKAQVERAIEGHVLGQAELMGTYARRR